MLRGKTKENNSFYLLSDEDGIVSVTKDATQSNVLQIVNSNNTEELTDEINNAKNDAIDVVKKELKDSDTIMKRL